MRHGAVNSMRQAGKAAATGRRQVLAGLGAVTTMAALGGCEGTGFLPGQREDPNFYRLTPKSTFSPDLPDVDWQLVVEPPVTSAGLSQLRIALMRNPVQVEYYARANWTDRAPSMLQSLMIESFYNSRRIVAVGRDLTGLRADFLLKTELREFQAEYFHENPLPHAHIGMTARLVAMPRRDIVSTQAFQSLIPAESDEIGSIIDAFDEALGAVLKRLVGWTLTTGQRVRTGA